MVQRTGRLTYMMLDQGRLLEKLKIRITEMQWLMSLSTQDSTSGLLAASMGTCVLSDTQVLNQKGVLLKLANRQAV